MAPFSLLAFPPLPLSPIRLSPAPAGSISSRSPPCSFSSPQGVLNPRPCPSLREGSSRSSLGGEAGAPASVATPVCRSPAERFSCAPDPEAAPDPGMAQTLGHAPAKQRSRDPDDSAPCEGGNYRVSERGNYGLFFGFGEVLLGEDGCSHFAVGGRRSEGSSCKSLCCDLAGPLGGESVALAAGRAAGASLLALLRGGGGSSVCVGVSGGVAVGVGGVEEFDFFNEADEFLDEGGDDVWVGDEEVWDDDDEALARMEERLDREGGADWNNDDTFGSGAVAWEFGAVLPREEDELWAGEWEGESVVESWDGEGEEVEEDVEEGGRGRGV